MRGSTVVIALVSMGIALLAGAPVAAELPDGPGKDTVSKICTGCHVATQFTSLAKTEDQWSSTVETMIGYGAKISDAQFEEIVGYLSAHFGLSGGGGQPAAKRR